MVQRGRPNGLLWEIRQTEGDIRVTGPFRACAVGGRLVLKGAAGREDHSAVEKVSLRP